MTQASITPPAYPTSKSGTDLASDLSAQSAAINSTHQGDTSPTYAEEGLVWSGKNGRVCRKLSSGDCIIGHRPITSLADLRNFGEGQRDEDVVRINIGDTVYFYFWDADSTAADNDSTIILPSGWATAGRWIRLNSGAAGGTAGWTEELATVLFGGSDYFEVFGDKTDIYEVDRALRLTQTTSGIGYVASVVLNSGGNTVVEVKGITVDAGLTKVEYGIEVGSQSYVDIPDIVFASEAEAKAGTGTTQMMNPLRTAQAIAALGRMMYSGSFSSSGTAVANTFYRCDGGLTLTLPALSGLNGGEVIAVAKDTSATVSVARSSTDTIANGLTSFTIPTKGDCAFFYANKAQGRWQVVYSPLTTTPANPYNVTGVMPTGSFIWFCGTTPPDDFLECNGAAVSRATYAALFAIIGTTYGTGDGSTTFNLPNLTTSGRFIRAKTATTSVGDLQDDAYLNHSHSASSNSTGAHTHTQGVPYAYDIAPANEVKAGTGANSASGLSCDTKIESGGAHSHTITVDTSTTGGTETRPKNIVLLPCIKY